MTSKVDLTRSTYPLLYWTTFLYIMGFPNFVTFDPTGRTADAINFSSIVMILLCCIAGYMFLVMRVLDRTPLLARRVHLDLPIWLALFVELVISSLLEPHSRLTLPTLGSHLITIFRFVQWLVCFGLVLALYTRARPEDATKLAVQFIGRISWIWIAIVYFVLPVAPAKAYGASDDSTDTVHRLGGGLVGPSNLASYASFAFFYALLFFPRGPRKVLACSLAAITVALTHARFQQAGFIFAIVVYLLILSGNTVARWATILATPILIVAALPFSGKLAGSFARGQTLQTLSTLDDRTRVWGAAWDAIKERPIIGYGYNQGAKHALRDFWTFHHWIPPHAHNEFIEFWLAGGIIALVLALFIYGHVFLTAIRDFRRGPEQLFFLIVFIMNALNSLSGTPFSFVYGPGGGLMVLCFFGILGGRIATPNALQRASTLSRVEEDLLVAS